MFPCPHVAYLDSPCGSLGLQATGGAAGKRREIIFLRHRIRQYPAGFVADLSFSSLESELKNIWIRCRIRWMRVDGSRTRKEKVAYSKIPGYVWTGLKSLHATEPGSALEQCSVTRVPSLVLLKKPDILNPLHPKSTLIDFALCNARRFYSV